MTRKWWIEPTRLALAAVARDDFEGAAGYLEQIALEGDLGNACLSVIDTMLAEHGVTGVMEDPPAGLVFKSLDTGAVSFADDVPATVAWAGRLVLARTRDDREQFEAVFHTLPEDGTWVQYPLTLMTSCLLMVQVARTRRAL